MDAAPIEPVEETLAVDATTASVMVAPALLDELWRACNATNWGLARGVFDRILLVAGLTQNFGLGSREVASRQQQAAFFQALKLDDLVLAKACAAGDERAWEQFMALYGQQLTRAAISISGSDTVGRDLSDAFYAELYGLTTRDGERRCPLDSYRGRGSLMGWLRTTLAQRYVDHYRRTFREEALDEQTNEASAPISAETPDLATVAALGAAVQAALRALPADDRFLLASYYLDRRTLADIAQVLRVHEATISRRLRRTAETVRKQLVRSLEKAGMNRRAAEEALGTDPRDVDLRVDLKKLLQSSAPEPFQERSLPESEATQKTIDGALLSDTSELLRDEARRKG